MTVNLTVNGVTYAYPETGDTNWGTEATDWATAVTQGMLQKAGGLFTLLSDVDFGASFGLKAAYYSSRNTNPASAGMLRLSNAESLSWRNFANSGDLALSTDSSDLLTYNGYTLGVITTVADTNSVDMVLTGQELSANVKLSASSAAALNQLVNLSIQSDGIRAQIPNTEVVAAGLLGGFITTATGDVTNLGTTNGSSAFTIAAGAVSLAKMANLAANSIIGNNTGSPATPLALTVTQVTAMLNAFVGDSGSGGTKGLVPAPAAGDAAAAKFLKADGTWATTPSGPVQATATVLGIVKGGTMPGIVAGTAIASGFVGEVITASGLTASGNTFPGSYLSLTNNLVLTAGHWMIYLDGGVTIGTPNVGQVSGVASIYDSTGATDLRLQRGVGYVNASTTGPDSQNGTYSTSAYVVITSGNTYIGRFTTRQESGTTTSVTTFPYAGAEIKAIRVG